MTDLASPPLQSLAHLTPPPFADQASIWSETSKFVFDNNSIILERKDFYGDKLEIHLDILQD